MSSFNTRQRATLDDGARFFVHNPALAALPPHPNPDAFNYWLMETRIAWGVTRWTKGGIYGPQFHVMVFTDADRYPKTSVTYEYFSSGCGYDKAALCFLRGLTTAIPDVAPPDRIVSFDAWMRERGLIVTGYCGIR